VSQEYFLVDIQTEETTTNCSIQNLVIFIQWLIFEREKFERQLFPLLNSTVSYLVDVSFGM